MDANNLRPLQRAIVNEALSPAVARYIAALERSVGAGRTDPDEESLDSLLDEVEQTVEDHEGAIHAYLVSLHENTRLRETLKGFYGSHAYNLAFREDGLRLDFSNTSGLYVRDGNDLHDVYKGENGKLYGGETDLTALFPNLDIDAIDAQMKKLITDAPRYKRAKGVADKSSAEEV